MTITARPDETLTTVWLTISQAAAEVGVSRRTIYNWMAANKLHVRRTAGGTTRIDSASLWHAPQ